MPDTDTIAPDARGQRGQSLVELALLLPVLMLILLGSVDFGRAYYTQVALVNAARVGAGFSIDPRWTQAEVKAKIQEETSTLLPLTTSQITLTASPAWSAGSDLTITVERPFTAVTPFIADLWGGGPLPIRARIVTRFLTP